MALFYDTYPDPDGRQFRGAWGVYPFLPSGNILVSDMQYGLFVFEGMGDNCAAQEPVSCEMTACATTSLTEVAAINSSIIQPNPIVDNFTLSINLANNLASLFVSLNNSQGQAIQTWTLDNLQAGSNDFSFYLPEQLPNGVYFLSLRSQQAVTTKKMILQR